MTASSTLSLPIVSSFDVVSSVMCALGVLVCQALFRHEEYRKLWASLWRPTLHHANVLSVLASLCTLGRVTRSFGWVRVGHTAADLVNMCLILALSLLALLFARLDRVSRYLRRSTPTMLEYMLWGVTVGTVTMFFMLLVLKMVTAFPLFQVLMIFMLATSALMNILVITAIGASFPKENMVEEREALWRLVRPAVVMVLVSLPLAVWITVSSITLDLRGEALYQEDDVDQDIELQLRWFFTGSVQNCAVMAVYWFGASPTTASPPSSVTPRRRAPPRVITSTPHVDTPDLEAAISPNYRYSAHSAHHVRTSSHLPRGRRTPRSSVTSRESAESGSKTPVTPPLVPALVDSSTSEED